jgi:putative transcription antitermination factor YqgF
MSTQHQITSQISHYLGIDYGKADVGLALADEETRIAFVYKTIKNEKNFLQKLAEIIEKENVKTVVVGMPYYNIGYEADPIKSQGDNGARKLGKFLEENLKVEVDYQNEMFTTKIAQANLIEKHVKGIKRYDDGEAARIILQEWLDRN